MKNAAELSLFLSEQENLIRQGLIQQSRNEILKIQTTDIPRALKARLGNIYRRLGQPNKTIRLLHKHVRPNGEALLHPATSREILEYGIALVHVGAIQEAMNLIKSLPAGVEPERDLYLSFALFAQWEYEESLPYLENYLSQDLPEYQRLVGQINYASALVSCDQHEKADSILQSVYRQTLEQNIALLNGFSLELMAQSQLWRRNKDFKKAREYLEIAQSKVSEKTKYALWIKKWLAIAELLQGRGDKALLAVRAEAARANIHETIRECDYFLALQNRDQKLFLNVYFGTPYAGYRSRIQKNFFEQVGKFQIPEFGTILDPNQTAKDSFDVDQCQLRSTKKQMSSSLKKRLLSSLLKDRYKPVRIASLFHDLYPNEYFNPQTSPNRVYVLKSRVENEIKKLEWPFKIKESWAGFFVEIPKDLELVLPHSLSSEDPQIQKLRRAFPKENFTASEVAHLLQISMRTAQRWLKQKCDEGHVIEVSASKPKIYKLGRAFKTL